MTGHRAPEVYRIERGTVAHRALVEQTAPALPELVEWCAGYLRGSRQAWSVVVLLREAGKAGIPTGGVSPHLLKHALSRHAEIVPLRKTLVAPVHTVGASATVADRIVRLLGEAREPQTLDEVCALVARSSTPVHPARVRSALAEAVAAGRLERGRARRGRWRMAWSVPGSEVARLERARAAADAAWSAWLRHDYPAVIALAAEARESGDEALVAWADEVVEAAREAIELNLG